MQKWEYLEIYIRGAAWVDSMGRSGMLPEQQAQPSGHHVKFYSTTSLLNELGLQGWEVSGVATSEDQRSFTLLLKRPIP